MELEESAYRDFAEKHDSFLKRHGDEEVPERRRKLPLQFLETPGLENALWPNLYWNEEMCETAVRASDVRPATPQRGRPSAGGRRARAPQAALAPGRGRQRLGGGGGRRGRRPPKRQEVLHEQGPRPDRRLRRGFRVAAVHLRPEPLEPRRRGQERLQAHPPALGPEGRDLLAALLQDAARSAD